MLISSVYWALMSLVLWLVPLVMESLIWSYLALRSWSNIVQTSAIDDLWIQMIEFVVWSSLGSLWKVISGAEVWKMDGVDYLLMFSWRQSLFFLVNIIIVIHAEFFSTVLSYFNKVKLHVNWTNPRRKYDTIH